MTAASSLTVTPREKIGKANRHLAAEQQIPAVLYGPGFETVSLSLDRHDFELFIAHHAVGSTIVDLEIAGTKKPVPAMIREMQRSAVKGTILHVDFLAINVNKPVHATLALHLVNDPEGVKAGGNLTVNLHEISVEAKPADLPEALEVDVAALQIGDFLHVSDIAAPSGVTILDDADAIVASVQAPRVEIEEVEEEVAEPELIGSKDESEEE